MKPGAPFTEIAPYYDLLMKDVDYKSWVKYIEDIFKLYGKNPKKIIDLACGTGTPSIILADKGYEVTGIDNSPYMLEIAKRKAGERENLKFLLADMRDFKIDAEPFDAAICLFDSINNFLEEEELLSVFQSVKRNLKGEGLFLFDMNTIYCLRFYWGDRSRVKEDGNIVSIWRTCFISDKNISELHITLFIPDREGRYKRIDEIHRERGYTLETIGNLLKKSGFRKVDFFEHLSFKFPTKTTLRVMVAAR
jgi:ubiquinone/menaquinone biosynthesis C-methylase UbiE